MEAVSNDGHPAVVQESGQNSDLPQDTKSDHFGVDEDGTTFWTIRLL